MTCTRCDGTGFLNSGQVPSDVLDLGVDGIRLWLKLMDRSHKGHDVSVCDCCGDGKEWHGEAGEHYNADDPRGMNGPYAYNGGFCECH